ncbi:MAG: PHP domain-containing protein [Micrococcales bacterium]|nr:PHP domain-containing protein [Micrococcales bacterium]
MLIDLHAHSDASDGTESPATVMDQAHAAGLDVVALTDHDTTAGWESAAERAAALDLTLVRGIEISCVHDGVSIHLLGYLIDPSHQPLIDELGRARESRATRLERMVAKMAEDDIPITIEDVRQHSQQGATLGRPHIADALVASGYVRDRDEAFADILHSAGRYYVRHYSIEVMRAIELVRAAGGVPVMAHPFASKRGRIVSDDVIREMAQAGLSGIEADHRDHSSEERERAARLAAELDLVRTGSSDYHGTGKPNRLGENTTAPEALEAIEALATSDIRLLRP